MPSPNQVRESYAIMKERSGEVTWDDMMGLLQKLAGEKRVTKEQLTEWWDGEEIDLEKFEYILEEARVQCVQGTPDQQAEKLRRYFITEIFTILDTNKDGKVSKAELVALMPDVSQTLRPITEADVSRWISEFGYKALMTPSQFVDIFEDGIFEDRADIPLPLFVRAARAQQEARQATKARAVKLMDRVRAISTKKDKAHDKAKVVASSTSPRTPANVAPSSPFTLTRSNVSFGSPHPHDAGSPTDLYATESDPASPAPSGKRRGMFSLGKKPHPAERDDARHEREVNTRLSLELQAKEKELARLHDVVAEREREILHQKQKQSSPTTPMSAEDQLHVLHKLEEADAQQDRLVDALDKMRDDMSDLEEMNKTIGDENARLKMQFSTFMREHSDCSEKIAVLQKQLQAERDKNRDLTAIRKKEAGEDIKRKADFSKVKTELKLTTEELTEAKDLIEKYEMEIAMFRLNSSDAAAASRRPSSQWDSEDSEGEGSHVVFLNPPRQKANSAAVHATLFTDPEPIYYEFPSQTRPTQLLFEVMLTDDRTTEYIACRDAAKKRSLSLVIERGYVNVPLCEPYRLVLNEWHIVSVTFHWPRHHYSLFIGSDKLCAEHAFRDASAAGVNSFDAYPRNDTSIVYANIRFVDC